jgi:hypothetical protein
MFIFNLETKSFLFFAMKPIDYMPPLENRINLFLKTFKKKYFTPRINEFVSGKPLTYKNEIEQVTFREDGIDTLSYQIPMSKSNVIESEEAFLKMSEFLNHYNFFMKLEQDLPKSEKLYVNYKISQEIIKWLEELNAIKVDVLPEYRKKLRDFYGQVSVWNKEFNKDGVPYIKMLNESVKFESDKISRVKSKEKKAKENQRSISTPNSFKLLKSDIKNAQNLKDVFTKLTDSCFISKECKYKSFKDVFSNETIKAKEKLNWIGSYLELNLFITLLMGELKKIEKQDYKWETTVKCFLKDNNEIRVTQLSKANGKRNRENELKNILKAL